MWRFLHLGRLVTPLALSFARDRRRWLIAGAGITRTPGFHAARAERVAHVIAGMGPTFIKLTQLFAGRRDLIPSPYIEALSTLTDRVPAVPWPAIRSELTRAYGQPPELTFDSIEAVPLAAASLGQVHRATLAGRDVVVKVLRPGVEAQIAADLQLARWLLQVSAARLRPPHVRGMAAVLDEFERRVADEMDFRQEARYATTIRRNFARVGAVRVPEVVESLTRRRALVLEYVEGTRIDRLDDSIRLGIHSPDRILRTVMELYIRMMLVDGLFHADPHPGNILGSDAGGGRIVR